MEQLAGERGQREQLQRARGIEYLTLSTAPFCVDDCGELDDRLKGLVKSYLTEHESVHRLKSNREILFDKPLVAPLVLTFNTPPSWFDDPRVRERAVIDTIERKTTPAQSKQFRSVLRKIRKGLFGLYILWQTADLTYDDLVAWYDAQPDLDGCVDDRKNTITRLYELGAAMFEAWFGVALDLSALPEMVQDTQSSGSEDLIDLLATQVRIARRKKTRAALWADEERWVNSEVVDYTHENVAGIAYTVTNLKDLKPYTVYARKRLALKEFAEIVHKVWDDVEYLPKATLKDRSKHSILWIPGNHVPREDVIDAADATRPDLDRTALDNATDTDAHCDPRARRPH